MRQEHEDHAVPLLYLLDLRNHIEGNELSRVPLLLVVGVAAEPAQGEERVARNDVERRLELADLCVLINQ